MLFAGGCASFIEGFNEGYNSGKSASDSSKKKVTPKSSNSPSIAQSQSSSSLVDECLKKMAETRNNYFDACRGSYSSTLPAILHYGAAISACTTEAQQRFPDVACYGVSLPAPSPPIGSTSRQGKNQTNTGWRYVLTIDGPGICPMQPDTKSGIYFLDHSEASGMKRICYYK